MKTLIITEKYSQAKDLRAAIGSKFGQILPAEGHLLRLAEPDEVNADWKRWSCNAEQTLPDLTDGETATLTDPKIEAKKTQPPPRYSEGTLVEAIGCGRKRPSQFPWLFKAWPFPLVSHKISERIRPATRRRTDGTKTRTDHRRFWRNHAAAPADIS